MQHMFRPNSAILVFQFWTLLVVLFLTTSNGLNYNLNPDVLQTALGINVGPKQLN